MAILSITNKATTTLSTTYGPIPPNETRNFSGLSTAQMNTMVTTLDPLVVAGTANYAVTVDPTGLAPGSFVHNVFGNVQAALQTNTGTQANTPVAVAAADSPYTCAAGVTFLCNATSGAISFVLPAASAMSGRNLRIKKTDVAANSVTVSRAGSDTIDGATSAVLKGQYDYIVLQSNGVATWNVFASLITP